MKILFITIIVTAVFSSCDSNPKKGYKESREIIPNPEGYQKDTFNQVPKDSTLTLQDSNQVLGTDSIPKHEIK
ncbi:hypothetical protein [Pedobacter sp. NJ-S-72]